MARTRPHPASREVSGTPAPFGLAPVAGSPGHRYLPKVMMGDRAMSETRTSETGAASPRPAAGPLRLVAFDGEDLAVVSAHLQDAVVRVCDLAYMPERNRFVLVARRFDWACCENDPRRCLSGLLFDRVLRARTRGLDLGRTDTALSLLAIRFEDTTAPSGTARLVFAGGPEIELELECLEARLQDLGPAWAAKSRPAHDLGND